MCVKEFDCENLWQQKEEGIKTSKEINFPSFPRFGEFPLSSRGLLNCAKNQITDKHKITHFAF